LKEELATRLICFGADGVNTFQGLRSIVTIRIQCRYAPFVNNVHYMAHQTNLTMQTLSNLPLVSCIESLLQCIYVYFSHRPKRHSKFAKLVEIMETKGNEILQNIKTRWISMLSFVKHVLSKYCILFMKMALNVTIGISAKSNLCLLTDVEMLLALNVVMPLLEVVHSLIKFTQLQDMLCVILLQWSRFVKGMYNECIVTSIPFSKVMCL